MPCFVAWVSSLSQPTHTNSDTGLVPWKAPEVGKDNGTGLHLPGHEQHDGRPKEPDRTWGQSRTPFGRVLMVPSKSQVAAEKT